MSDILITGATRTPIGAFNGGLSKTSAVELGTIAVKASIAKAGIDKDMVEEVILGNVIQAGLGQNPARQVSLHCEIPQQVPSYTVNQVCGSGLKAIDLAWKQIKLGEANVVIAGGIENMSLAPHLLPSMRNGARLGDTQVIDTIINDALSDPIGKYHMGITTENIAKKYNISRKTQDEFSLKTQQKYAKALKGNLFKDEITPVVIKKRGKEIIVDTDEHPRLDASAKSLSSLRPAFKKDGSVTAGNASGINDGAASVVILNSDILENTNVDIKDCFKIKDVVSCGCDPELMGLGPIYAVEKLLQRQNMQAGDINLWEINEAFAAQSIAVIDQLKINPEIVNVNGGAIALGHPVGASGARIVVTLMHEMKRQNLKLGIATLCVGGGMGLAILLENIN